MKIDAADGARAHGRTRPARPDERRGRRVRARAAGSRAPHGLDRVQRRRGLAQLAAQVRDVGLHRRVVADERLLPHRLVDPGPGEHLPGGGQQQVQQPQLGRGQRHLGPVQPHARGGGVEGERPVDQRCGLRCGARGGAAQQRLDAGGELGEVEGLGHVVVGAQAQHVHLGVDGVLRRQHQHRHRARAADLREQHRPVDVREHQVQHHQVDVRGLAVRGEGGAGGEPVDRGDHLVPLVAQGLDQQGADVGGVLDDEDAGGGHRAEPGPVTAWTIASTAASWERREVFRTMS